MTMKVKMICIRMRYIGSYYDMDRQFGDKIHGDDKIRDKLQYVY